MTESIIELMKVPRDLVLEFIGTFARFEFALKRADLVIGNERGVLADWNVYSDHLEKIEEQTLQPVLQQAAYLESHPPMKQIKKDGRLTWAPVAPEKTRIRKILLDVRTVRNNLFHGGKFPGQYVQDPCRDEQLILSCVAVLNALVALPDPNPIAQHFNPEG